MTRTTMKNWLSAALIAGLMITGCTSNMPFESAESTSNGKIALQKNAQGDEDSYPQMAAETFSLDLEQGLQALVFNGGKVILEDGSEFNLIKGALTPPPGSDPTAPVEIQVQAEFIDETNEMVFTFAPHGAVFDPPAEMWFNYGKLGAVTPEIYYIEDDGSYTPLNIAELDTENRRVKLMMDHFSRYAIAHSQ